MRLLFDISRLTDRQDEGPLLSFDLQDDPRWRRLFEKAWSCPCCGEQHAGLIAFGAHAPDYWRGARDYQPIDEVRSAKKILTSDFCIIDEEAFFIRCVLELPIIGAQGMTFEIGAWSSLAKNNFVAYLEHYDDQDQVALGPWFGWFSNRLKGYADTQKLKCAVQPRSGGLRPSLELEPTDHPLAVQQRDGISFDQILDFYALNGHDIRDSLGA